MRDRTSDLNDWKALDDMWDVVRRAVDRQINRCLLDLAERSKTSTLEDVRSLQAKIEALKTLINLPRHEIQQLKGAK